MNFSMMIFLFVIGICLVTVSYFVGEIVGSKRTAKKIQRFLESYSYVKSLNQLDVNALPAKNKPRLFVLKNDDFKQK
jgi:hypothetical protein